MTWKELAKLIGKMTEDQQNTDVTIADTEVAEAFPVNDLLLQASEQFGLDVAHPYLTMRDDDHAFAKQVNKEVRKKKSKKRCICVTKHYPGCPVHGKDKGEEKE